MIWLLIFPGILLWLFYCGAKGLIDDVGDAIDRRREREDKWRKDLLEAISAPKPVPPRKPPPPPPEFTDLPIR